LSRKSDLTPGTVKLTEPSRDSPQNDRSPAIAQQAHVTSSQLEKARAHLHLEESGLFVFDVNTLAKLRQFNDAPMRVHQFSGNFLLMDVSCDSLGLSRWNIKVFERQPKGLYRLHAEDILEKSFPHTKIQEALRAKFKKVRVLDLSQGRVSGMSERLHFICEK